MKCAPKIWKKFKPRQKRLWHAFYKRFLVELNVLKDGSRNCPVIAHNLACEAVWVEANELGLYE